MLQMYTGCLISLYIDHVGNWNMVVFLNVNISKHRKDTVKKYGIKDKKKDTPVQGSFHEWKFLHEKSLGVNE